MKKKKESMMPNRKKLRNINNKHKALEQRHKIHISNDNKLIITINNLQQQIANFKIHMHYAYIKAA
jgi:hypothetical protein